MIVARIESAADPRLAPFLAVRDRDALGPDGRPGLFVGESPLVIEAMLRAPVETLSILASERHEARARALVEAARPCRAGRADPEILLAPDEVLDAAVGFSIHRGFLAIGRRPAPRTVREVVPASGDCLLLVVEDVNNIDNIGQLFRNAAAFGCAAVVLSPACHDPLYRKSLRVSCGHALRAAGARRGDRRRRPHARRDRRRDGPNLAPSRRGPGGRRVRRPDAGGPRGLFPPDADSHGPGRGFAERRGGGRRTAGSPRRSVG